METSVGNRQRKDAELNEKDRDQLQKRTLDLKMSQDTQDIQLAELQQKVQAMQSEMQRADQTR